MKVYNCWGFSKMNQETKDKLKIAASNGLKFEFQASQSNLAEYIHMIDIVGSHDKSKIEIFDYE